MKLTAKTTTGPGHTVVCCYFSSLITAHSALFTTSSPISPPSSLRQGYDRQAGPVQRLFQEPPAKSNFLAAPLALSQEGKPFHFLGGAGGSPFMLLVIAYATRRMPYVVRSAVAGLQQSNPMLEEAAKSLGATPARMMRRIALPLISTNLAAGCILVFAFAMLEVSGSLILAQQAQHYPITKAIYTLLSTLGNGTELAAALGVWAMVFLSAAIIALGVWAMVFLSVAIMGAAVLGGKRGGMFKL